VKIKWPSYSATKRDSEPGQNTRVELTVLYSSQVILTAELHWHSSFEILFSEVLNSCCILTLSLHWCLLGAGIATGCIIGGSSPGAPSLGVKRPADEADSSPPPSAAVKNAWSYTSTLPIRFKKRGRTSPLLVSVNYSYFPSTFRRSAPCDHSVFLPSPLFWFVLSLTSSAWIHIKAQIWRSLYGILIKSALFFFIFLVMCVL